MKLATLKDDSRDGYLVVVSRDLTMAVSAIDIAPTLQNAIERWAEVEPQLQVRYQALNDQAIPKAFAFDPKQAAAPLPRAYQWCDGSAFMSHGELMEKAFDIDPIEGMDIIPLMYQGGSDDFLGACDNILQVSEAHGIDFEGEFAVMVDDVPMSCTAEEAEAHIKLILQVNDVSLRTLGPREMKTGFGFLQAKPSSSFAPVAVTPDELGTAWRNGRVNLPLNVTWNGEWFGHPHGSEMQFSFPQLIAHACLTRRLRAGTLIGSGTVSNRDRSVGSSCIAERRAIEMMQQGRPLTSFMRFGDRVRMETCCVDGSPLFGAIDQLVLALEGNKS